MEENLNSKNNNSKIVVIILSVLLICALGFICYDKFINKEKPPVPTPTLDNNIKNDENEITSLKRIEISDENQIVNVDGKEFKIKKENTVDGAFLLIDDAIQYIQDNETAYAELAYVTNKFIIFTVIAQDGEIITYAIDKKGNQIIVDDTNKEKNEISEDTSHYQLHNLKIINNNLQASGHIFCGLDGDCPDKMLIIKYADNKIIVKPVE